MQQGDVKLFQTFDGGEITSDSGLIEMTDGIETAVYLSLFGGNQHDTGADNDPNNWWGNLVEPDIERHYRSETQNLIGSLPITSGNLLRIKDAVTRDLKWLDADVEVTISIPQVNSVVISVLINKEQLSFYLEKS